MKRYAGIVLFFSVLMVLLWFIYFMASLTAGVLK